jgi:hypothetical protein
MVDKQFNLYQLHLQSLKINTKILKREVIIKNLNYLNVEMPYLELQSLKV